VPRAPRCAPLLLVSLLSLVALPVRAEEPKSWAAAHRGQLLVLAAAVAYSGVAIAARETRYAGRQQENPFGTVNAMIGLGGAGLMVGLSGGALVGMQRADSYTLGGIFDTVLTSLIGGAALGLVGVATGAFLGGPFNREPGLYYAGPAVGVALPLLVLTFD
jgi:hypothetical protein